MSFSQNDEERYIVAAVDGITNHRLLDIGAWAPEDKSNSRRLIMGGWEAILIDPTPAAVRHLAAYYDGNENITVISAAVGLEPGFLRLDLSDDAVSTSSPEHRKKWDKVGKYYGAALFPAITLPQISVRFGGFEFVNIDTETTSVDICRRMMELHWTPRCVCVEHDDRLTELGGFMTVAGYKMVYSSLENAVFVR